MARIAGTASADTLPGTSLDDEIDGLDGNDTIFGNGGNDTINGGNGDDTIFGDNTGSVGHDVLSGGAGNDSLTAGDGNDILNGDAGNDSLFGGDGNDTLDGGTGRNWLLGQNGNDTYIISDVRTYINDTSGTNVGYITVDFYKAAEGITWGWAPGVQKLPYWVDSLTLNAAPSYISDRSSPTIIHYYFPTTAPTYQTAEERANFKAFNSQQQQWTLDQLNYISSQVNIQFVQVFSEADAVANPGTVVFQFSDRPNAASDEMVYNPPNRLTPQPNASNIWIKNDGLHENFADGQRMSWILIHAIGHAIGLKHPFAAAGTEGGSAESPYLPTADDSRNWTVMSYTAASDERDGNYHGVYKPLDLQALMYLYGVSPSLNAGNNTYVLSSAQPNFINDGAGIDAIDGSSQTQGLSLHLSAGYWDYIGTKGSVITQAGQVTVGFGSVIENAYGGSGNDTITGNDAANTISGGRGADTLFGGNGVDTLGYHIDPSGGSAQGIYVNLAANVALDTGGAVDVFTGFENIVGTNNPYPGGYWSDFLIGDASANVIAGLGGNDYIAGGLGIDYLVGGTGTDWFIMNGDIVAGGYDVIGDFNSGGETDYLALPIAQQANTVFGDAGGYAYAYVSLGGGNAYTILVSGITGAQLQSQTFFS